MTSNISKCIGAVAIIFSIIGGANAQYLSFHHDGLTREYVFHIPENLPKNAPLVIVMHGYSSDAFTIQEYSGMDEVADKHGFVVCYPRGSVDHRGNRFWNVGYDFHPDVTIDDVDFIVKLAQYLQKEHELSAQNTFATGMSNGGEMSYLLACRAPNIFRAVAPVAGMMLKKFFANCNSRIPVFEIHGTADDINRFTGDIHGDDGWGAYPDIPHTINYWVNQNGCSSIEIDSLTDLNTKDSSYVVSQKHVDCKSDNQVWLYKIINGKHDWPGSTGNMDIDTSKEIWKFFQIFIID